MEGSGGKSKANVAALIALAKSTNIPAGDEEFLKAGRLHDNEPEHLDKKDASD